MFNALTEKLLIAAGIFVLTAALTVSAVQLIPEASAKSEQAATIAQKTPDRSRAEIGTCSAKSWPHYEAHCLTDHRAPGRETAKPVRVISLR